VWTCFGYPPLLVAEIVNVPFLSDEEIQRLAKLYVKHGADVVDIGMVAGRKHPEDAERAVRSVFEAVKKPVSIDSNDVEEIKFAVEVGADLILSINGENMEEASKISSLTNKYVVVTPVDEAGKIPENYVERVNQLELNIKKARLLGFKHIIADPLLTVQNFVDSLMGYVEFRRRNPETPLLFGAGNITELVDVDSVGINFLLALLAWEVGVNLVFTTQASNKTQESVKELSTAIKMVALAKRRETPPKDLGIDLLILKEKKRKDEAFEEAMNEKWVKIVKAQTTEEYVSDPLGYFKVRLNRETEEILVFHYRYGKEKPDFVVKGKNPKDIYRRIFEENLISRLDHAAYLGSELQKARIALKTGKSYIQDNELFG
ncbi:dihydropteroate synthase-like protein, partial [Candidatus Bathyarchaeota archaeon]